MAKPVLLVTRKLPEAVEARAARDYDARLDLDNAHGANWRRDRPPRPRGCASGVLWSPATALIPPASTDCRRA